MARRRKKNRRSQALPWIVSVAAALLALLLLANVVFVVREVKVVGAGEVPEADVRHLSGIALGSRIDSVNAEKVRQAVESDGRVAFVGLRKRLPHTVVPVEITLFFTSPSSVQPRATALLPMSDFSPT